VIAKGSNGITRVIALGYVRRSMLRVFQTWIVIASGVYAGAQPPLVNPVIITWPGIIQTSAICLLAVTVGVQSFLDIEQRYSLDRATKEAMSE
jgi:hypothetical protein